MYKLILAIGVLLALPAHAGRFHHISIHDYCVKHADEYANYKECHEEVAEDRREHAAERRARIQALASDQGPPGFMAPQAPRNSTTACTRMGNTVRCNQSQY